MILNSGPLTNFELKALESTGLRDDPDVKEARSLYDLAHRQCEWLIQLVPDRANSYRDQLQRALAENRSALIRAIGFSEFRNAVQSANDDEHEPCPRCGK